MAALELDPLFRRGLRLLHSRSKDSGDQLKALLDEVSRQRQGKSVLSLKDPLLLGSQRRESPIPRAKQGSPLPLKRDADRRINIRDEEMVPLKRSRLDSPVVFKSHSPSPTPSSRSGSSSISRRSDPDSDSEEADINDLAMEIIDDINCTVCKSFSVSSRNKLVECQECHVMYHQECHSPPVTDQEINDPRLIWYCFKCHRSLRKQGGVLTSTTANPNASSKTTVVAPSKGTTSRPAQSPSKSTVGQQPRVSPFANLASASGRTLGSASSSVANSASLKAPLLPPPPPPPANAKGASATVAPNSMVSAEKRMLMMKKKAAAKMAEKRKL